MAKKKKVTSKNIPVVSFTFFKNNAVLINNVIYRRKKCAHIKSHLIGEQIFRTD